MDGEEEEEKFNEFLENKKVDNLPIIKEMDEVDDIQMIEKYHE